MNIITQLKLQRRQLETEIGRLDQAISILSPRQRRSVRTRARTMSVAARKRIGAGVRAAARARNGKTQTK